MRVSNVARESGPETELREAKRNSRPGRRYWCNGKWFYNIKPIGCKRGSATIREAENKREEKQNLEK